MNEEVIITHHGYERAKQRCGLDAKALRNTAQKAWSDGLQPSELSGRLRRYVDGMAIEKKGVYRIHGNHIFCFSADAVLITVLELPHAHRGAAASALRKRKRSAES